MPRVRPRRPAPGSSTHSSTKRVDAAAGGVIDTAAKRDYYEVLGLSRDADAKAIRDAFRTLALQYHPDRNKEPGAQERFKEIAEAYAVLSDATRRREYDARGFAAFDAAQDLFAGIDFEDLLSGAGLRFGGFEEFDGGLFDRLFGRRRAPSSRGEDVAIEIRLPLERIAAGGDETIRVPRSTRCTACAGSGAKDGKARPCEACRGTGREVKTRAEGGITLTQARTCAACGGRGRLVDEPCPACRGTGSVEETQAVTLQVPPGIEDGTVLRVAGHGLPGAPPGDLLISVRSTADPRFERDGADLWRVEALTIPQAVLGMEREVPTLGRPAVVKVPAGTQPGSVLRLRGKGLPKYGSRAHGDLLVRIRVDVPSRLSPEERALYARLLELEAASRKT